MLRCDVSGCDTEHGDIPSLRDAPKGELHQARWAGRRADTGDEPLHDGPQQDHEEIQHSYAGILISDCVISRIVPVLRARLGFGKGNINSFFKFIMDRFNLQINLMAHWQKFEKFGTFQGADPLIKPNWLADLTPQSGAADFHNKS